MFYFPASVLRAVIYSAALPAGLLAKLLVITFIAAATWPGAALAQRPLGVDVSYWQASSGMSQSTWNSFFAAGRTFAYVRCTHYSETGESDAHGNPDPTCAINASRARTAGLLVGLYHFARPTIRSPQTEADAFANFATVYFGTNLVSSGYLRPVLDLEEGGGTTPVGATNMSNWVNAWIDAVRQQTGAEAMIYSNSNYANNYLNSTVASRTLWLANWNTCTEPPPTNPSPPPSDPTGVWSNWTFWQYCSGSGGGNVAGVPVDVDVFNGTAAQMQSHVLTTDGPAMIVLNPTALTRTVAPGNNLPQESFTVKNDTSIIRATLNYTISDNAGWLSVAPTSGASSGAANPHTITYSTSSLARGHYTGNITVTAPFAINSPEQLTIDLYVQTPGDTDGDGDADLTDFGLLQACLADPQVVAPPACEPADFDQDTHVGQGDVTIFIKCLSGANIAVISGCDAS